jgi:hypothetical protein
MPFAHVERCQLGSGLRYTCCILGACATAEVHLVQVVLNWYNLVAASAAGGVPFCD